MRLRFIFPALMLIVGALLASPAAANANINDGSDPGWTGCGQTGETIYSFNSQQLTFPVYVELRFSTYCDTAWARISCNPPEGGGCGNTLLSVQRVAGPDGFVEEDIRGGGGQSSFYTLQVYDGGNDQSRACINLDTAYAECTSAF
jgi:hypothetical protein